MTAMGLTCRVRLEKATYTGEILKGEIRIGKTRIDLNELDLIAPYGPNRRRLALKNGSEIHYLTQEAGGSIRIRVPGITEPVDVDVAGIEALTIEA
jgi:hypothetical protein